MQWRRHQFLIQKDSPGAAITIEYKCIVLCTQPDSSVSLEGKWNKNFIDRNTLILHRYGFCFFCPLCEISTKRKRGHYTNHISTNVHGYLRYKQLLQMVHDA